MQVLSSSSAQETNDSTELEQTLLFHYLDHKGSSAKRAKEPQLGHYTALLVHDMRDITKWRN